MEPLDQTADTNRPADGSRGLRDFPRVADAPESRPGGSSSTLRYSKLFRTGDPVVDWEQYRESYERAFGAEPEVGTDRYKAIAADAEATREWLGGPLSLMLTQRSGDVIFQDPERFRGVENAEDFLRLCTSQVEQYRVKVSEHEPEDDAERTDQALLRQVADDMEEVCLLAHEIVQEEEEAA